MGATDDVGSHAPPGATARAQTLREVLATPVLAGSEVVAGHAGLDRRVERLNVMEVPDILPWVKPAELLLTTGYPLHERPEELARLVADLDDAGLAGLGVKLGRYLDALPAPMLEVAEDRGFAIVLLPGDISFDEVFHEVLTRMLNQQAEQLARSERIHHAFLQLVLEGHGLGEIAAELADLLDGPAAILGPDGEVLAGARLDDIRGLEGAVERVGLDPAAGVARLVGREVVCRSAPISVGSRLHGHAVALAARGHLPDDRMALENAATTAALTLTKAMELEAVEAKYQSDLIHDLLTGRLTADEDPHARAAQFGWELDRPLAVIVLEIDEPTGVGGLPPGGVRPPLVAAVRARMRACDASAAVVRFSDEVVILTGACAEGDRDGARRFARELAEHCARSESTPVSVGLSRPVPDLGGVPHAYAQATAAVSIGRRIHGPGAVSHFDDLGVYRLLHLIDDADELRSFAAEVLGELAGDDGDAGDLRETLRVLLEVNCNVAEAARRLHFHYNTLRYRITKLEEIVGPFTDDARVRLDVHVAMLILAMRTLARPG